MNEIEIIPTCVPQDAVGLAKGVQAIRGFSSVIHIDIDDDIFTPVITWPYTGPGVFGRFDLASVAGMEAEIHLMVASPRAIGIEFARAGAFRVVGHIEGFGNPSDAHSALDVWRENGAHEVGVGVLMHTSLDILEPLIAACDVVHMMSIATIGTQGIPYDIGAPARIAELHSRHPELLISVDGGVSEKNITDLVKAGARRFGVGSAIMKDSDPKAAYERLKLLAESALY